MRKLSRMTEDSAKVLNRPSGASAHILHIWDPLEAISTGAPCAHMAEAKPVRCALPMRRSLPRSRGHIPAWRRVRARTERSRRERCLLTHQPGLPRLCRPRRAASEKTVAANAALFAQRRAPRKLPLGEGRGEAAKRTAQSGAAPRAAINYVRGGRRIDN